MSRRIKILLIIFSASVIFLLLKLPEIIDGHRDVTLRSPQPAPTMPKKENDFFEKFAQVEAIEDPLERCKSIPIPEGVNWTQATIDAFCADINMPSMSWFEIQTSIKDGSGRLLDARFDNLISGYFSGIVDEGTMRSAYYKNFDISSAEGLRLAKQWLSSSPNSPHALTASGMTHLANAFHYRGFRFIADTPKEQIRKMEEEVTLAIKDLEKALDLNPKIMPAYESIIDCARLMGDTELASRYLQKAQAVDPKNYYVLFGYSMMLEPRWGGSLQELKEIAETAKRLMPTNPRMANLIASAKTYSALGIEHKIDDQEELKILREAIADGPLNDTLTRYAALCSRLGDHRRAYEMYTQLLRFYPNDSFRLANRAREATSLGAYDYARKDIRAARRLDPMNAFALQEDVHLDLFANKYLVAEKKLKILINLNPSDEWSIEQLAWIAVFRTQNIAQAQEMIGRGLALNPEKGSFHWLNWELIRRAGLKNLREATDDFIAHADKTDSRQVDALQYAK